VISGKRHVIFQIVVIVNLPSAIKDVGWAKSVCNAVVSCKLADAARRKGIVRNLLGHMISEKPLENV
jgi:hypothetical protein